MGDQNLVTVEREKSWEKKVNPGKRRKRRIRRPSINLRRKAKTTVLLAIKHCKGGGGDKTETLGRGGEELRRPVRVREPMFAGDGKEENRRRKSYFLEIRWDTRKVHRTFAATAVRNGQQRPP